MLHEGSKYHPKAEFREKCQGLLLNHSGMSYDKIAKHLETKKNIICTWVKSQERGGILGLHRKSGQGRKHILSISNKKHTHTLDKAIETHYQNIKAIQVELVKELEQPMSTDTVKRFLKKTIIRRDTSVAVRTKDKIKKSIQIYMSAGKYFQHFGYQDIQNFIAPATQFADQSGFTTQPYVTYGWQKKKQTKRIFARNNNKKLNVMGFMSLSGHLKVYHREKIT